MKILIKDVLAVMPEGAENCSIFIDGGAIVSTGAEPEGFVADRVIDGSGLLAVPGFVNAHTHNYMTVMRGYADDLPFDKWLFGRVMPFEDRIRPDDAYWSCMLAAMEMIRSGTTAYLDMHMFPDVTVQAALDSGMRAVVSRGLSGGEDDPEGGARRLREAVGEMEKYKDVSPRITFKLAPHAVYTCGGAYLREIAEKAHELGVGIHTHLAETDSEVRGCYEKHGCSPVELFDRFGLLRSDTVAAHCVRLSIADINILSYRGVSAAINTASNLKLGNGTPPIASLRRHGVNLCLGTDSAASNNSLSILREMQLFSLVHKGITKDSTAVPAGDCFDMATKNGARALGLEGVTGELKAGLRADIALFPLTEPEQLPVRDVKSLLCYSSSALKADTVIIDGEIVLDRGEFKTFDPERVIFEASSRSRKLESEGKTANV